MVEKENKEICIPNSRLFNKTLSYKEITKKDPLEGKNIDYKNIELLREYLSEGYKILPSRNTGTSAKNQKKLALSVKRAQKLALIPFG